MESIPTYGIIPPTSRVVTLSLTQTVDNQNSLSINQYRKYTIIKANFQDQWAASGHRISSRTDLSVDTQATSPPSPPTPSRPRKSFLPSLRNVATPRSKTMKRSTHFPRMKFFSRMRLGETKAARFNVLPMDEGSHSSIHDCARYIHTRNARMNE